MAYTFADYPEIAFALPFENLSFERWDDTLPEEWENYSGSPTGTRTSHNPGFDLTRALKIEQSGVVSVTTNALKQEIITPDYIQNGQHIRGGMVIKSDLEGSYGAGKGFLIVGQNGLSLTNLVTWRENETSWNIQRADSINAINTGYSDLIILLYINSYSSESDPACLFDCIFAEYGRDISERYYAFIRKPAFQGIEMIPQTFVQDERTGIGKRRTWDPTGGAVKWRIKFPFIDIPGAMADALYEFFSRNKGLDDSEGVHLVLHHMLIDTSESYNLRQSPWIVCDIANDTFPLSFSGGYMGAKLWSGTFVFEEV